MVSAVYLHWLFSVPVGITVSILGLIGNVISIIIWRRLINLKLRQNRSTGIYLIALGTCDSGLLVFFLLQDSLPAMFPSLKEESYSYAVFYCWIGFPFFFIYLIASIWLVVGVTLNRFFMIILPVKVRTLYTPKRTYLGIFGFLVFSLLINIPHFFNYKPKEVDRGKWKVATTIYGDSKEAKDYEFWLHCIFLVLAPWLCIAVLNSIILYKLSKRKETKSINNSFKYETKSSKKSKQQNREEQMTRTLLVITFSFLVLLAWQCVSQCFWMEKYGKGEKHSRTWETVDKNFAFGKMGVIINSSLNCLLYCMTGSMFKKELVRMFCFKSFMARKMFGSFSRDRSSTSGTASTTRNTLILENSETNNL